MKVQSVTDAHLIYVGKVSGRQYEWSRAGDVVEVEEEDTPELLTKRIGTRSCCGTGNGNQVFQGIN
jgi:hypothetical protein